MDRYFEAGEIWKWFLDSLPSKWRVYCILVKRFENIVCLTIESLVAILETYNVEMMCDEEKNTSYNRSGGHALISPINFSSTSSYVVPSNSLSNYQQYQHGSPASTQSNSIRQQMTPPAQQPFSTFVVSEEHSFIFCVCC